MFLPNRLSKIKADYLIFTSPSNADAYLDLHELDENQVVVAIGKTTETALERHGVLNIICAEHPGRRVDLESYL